MKLTALIKLSLIMLCIMQCTQAWKNIEGARVQRNIAEYNMECTE